MDAIKRFIIEKPLWITLIITVLTLGIVGYSVYLPKLPRAIPTQQIDTTIPSTVPSTTRTQTNSKKIVVAGSQRTDYRLTLVNTNGLTDMLQNLDVWGKTYPSATKDSVALTTLVIYLSNKQQELQGQDQNGSLTFSYSLNFTKDIGIITVYLPDSVLSTPAASQAFGTAVAIIASKLGGTNKTLVEIPNSNIIPTMFALDKALPDIPIPAK